MDTRETISNFTSIDVSACPSSKYFHVRPTSFSTERDKYIKTSIIKTLKVKARTYRYREEPLQKSPTSCWLVDETRRTKGETRENNVSTLINRAINWKKKKKRKIHRPLSTRGYEGKGIGVEPRDSDIQCMRNNTTGTAVYRCFPSLNGGFVFREC